MSESGIDLHAVTNGPLLRAFEPVARLFTFPDGIERIIALDRRLWEAYDVLDAAWGFLGDYERSSYEWAFQKCPYPSETFEAKLRHGFNLCIETGWALFNQEKRGSVNDNLV